MLGIDARLMTASTMKWIIIGIAAGIASIALTIALYWFLGKAVDEALAGRNLLAGSVALVAAFVFGRALLAWLYRTAQFRASSETKVSVRDLIYRHALRLGPGLLTKDRTGGVVNTAVDGMDWLEKYYGVYFVQFAIGMSTPVLLCVFITAVDWVVGLSLILSIPLTPLFIGVIARNFRDVSRRYADVLNSQSAQFLDSIQGMATLKQFNLSRRRGAEMAEANESLRRETMRLLFVNQMMIAIVDFGFALCSTVIVTAVALVRLKAGFLTPGEVVALVFISVEFSRPLSLLGEFFFAGAVGREIARKVGAFLDIKPGVVERASLKPPPPRADRSAVEFDTVTFRYDGADTAAIDGLTLKLEAGETVALIGRSGSGKTTVANLILRTIEPSGGQIRIAGTPVGDLPIDWVRSEIALVPQDPYLFFGTIADNLRIAKPDATEKELEAATRAAEIYDYIRSTPLGFDTLVGEQGLTLSGGQVQRLAIARALLKDAPIVILDEPTSQIDVETEALVNKALKRLTEHKTVLLIAHRLSTVEKADRIAVMERGRIVESGTREDLVRQGGLYARMLATKRRAERQGFTEVA